MVLIVREILVSQSRNFLNVLHLEKCSCFLSCFVDPSILAINTTVEIKDFNDDVNNEMQRCI